MIKITSLCDNYIKNKKMWAMEGNATLIEVDDYKILYDVGRNHEILLHNLDVLGIKPQQITHVVASHAHYGHTGSFAVDKNLFENAIVLYGSKFDTPKYKLKDNQHKKVDNARLHHCITTYYNAICVQDHYKITPDVITYKVPHVWPTNFAADEKHLVLVDDKFEKDAFEEELALSINTSKGLIVLTGCAHRGVRNTLEQAKKLHGTDAIWALIGGTHIFDDKQLVAQYVDEVQQLNVQYVAPSHCTGCYGKAYILDALPDKFLHYSTGVELKFDK